MSRINFFNLQHNVIFHHPLQIQIIIQKHSLFPPSQLHITVPWVTVPQYLWFHGLLTRYHQFCRQHHHNYRNLVGIFKKKQCTYCVKLMQIFITKTMIFCGRIENETKIKRNLKEKDFIYWLPSTQLVDPKGTTLRNTILDLSTIKYTEWSIQQWTSCYAEPIVSFLPSFLLSKSQYFSENLFSHS